MVACTTKLAKRMEAIMKQYRFEDADLVKFLWFLWQFDKVCDFNGESEGIEMYLLPLLMAKFPAASPTIYLKPRKTMMFWL